MLIFFALMAFISCLVAAGECFYERDWPRSTGKFALVFLLLLLLSVPVFAQGVRYDNAVTTSATNVPPGAQAQVLTVPNALISVCNYPATGGQPCTNYATVYSDAALTQPILQPVQADGQGRFGFYVTPGVALAFSYQKANAAFLGTFAVNIPSTLLAGTVGALVGDSAGGSSLSRVTVNGAFNPSAYGKPSNGDASTATCTTTAGSTAVTCGTPGNFSARQGILLSHAGPACGVTRGIPAPLTGPTVTAVATGSGSTTYTYNLAYVDELGCESIAGNAVSVANASTLSATVYNTLTIPLASGGTEVAIYRNNALIATWGVFSTAAVTFTDTGQVPFPSHRDLSLTPPSVAVGDNLPAIIKTVSGSSLTLDRSATTAFSGTAYHSDAPLIQAAKTAAGNSGVIQGDSLYRVNYPLNFTDWGGTVNSLNMICDTGGIGVDFTGQNNMLWNNTRLDLVGSAQACTIGRYFARDAANTVSQGFNAINGFTWGTSLADYNYGAEIQWHANQVFAGNAGVMLTERNMWNQASPFVSSQLTGIQSMSQIDYDHPIFSNSGSAMILNNAFTVNLFGGYGNVCNATSNYAFQIFGEAGQFNATDFRTENCAGVADIQAYPAGSANGLLAYSNLIYAPYFIITSPVPAFRLRDGGQILYAHLTTNDFGGSGSSQAFYACDTSSCQIRDSVIEAAFNQPVDPTHIIRSDVYTVSDTTRRFSYPAMSTTGTWTSGSAVQLGSTGVDLNTLVNCGTYAGQNLINGPMALGTNLMTIDVQCNSPSYETQIAYNNIFTGMGAANTLSFFVRVKILGTWQHPSGSDSNGWLREDINGVASLDLGFFTPASSSAPCSQGQHSFNAGFAFYCVATNTWKENAINSF